MIYIYDIETFGTDRKHIESFRILYDLSFPDANEREDFEVICKRVIAEPAGNDPYTFLILFVGDNTGDSPVMGGLIADWYTGCPTIHLTYIAVDPGSRGKKIAGTLLQEGMEEIKKIIHKKWGNRLNHIVLESNIPWVTKIDSFDNETRLFIFHKLGAKWIDIPYIQPALDRTKQRVSNLFLLTIPSMSGGKGKISSSDVTLFLSNLYKGLGTAHPEEDADFVIMLKSLHDITDEDGNVELKDIPGEFPVFSFRKVSVTLHFFEEIQDSSGSRRKNLRGDFDTTPCRWYGSYEKDLMNFQSQKMTPFVTRLRMKSSEIPLTIKFPEHYSYTSEGRSEHIFTNRPEISASLSVSVSHFRDSGVKVWHLTFSPGRPEEFFTEHDIIKLSNFFGSTQENMSVAEQIRVRTGGSQEWTDVTGIPGAMGLCDANKKLTPSGTGIIAIDSDDVLSGIEKNESEFAELYELFSKDEGTFAGLLEDKYYSDMKFRDLMNMMCGITLGILDFRRMDAQEVLDTLKPINIFSDSFMVVARGALICLSSDDELFDDVYDTLGVSPYLLVPSAYLSHNEHILSKARAAIDEVLDRSGMHMKVSLSELEKISVYTQDMLNHKYVMNPFQYPTENNIVIEADRQRSMEDVGLYIKYRIDELRSQIEQKTNFRASVIEASMTSFLMLISVLQIYSTIKEWFDNKILFRVTFISLSLLLMAGFFLMVLGKNNWIKVFLRRILKRKK